MRHRHTPSGLDTRPLCAAALQARRLPVRANVSPSDLAALRERREPSPAGRDERSVPRELDLLVLDEIRIGAWEHVLVVECGDGWAVEEAWRRMTKGYACGVDTSVALVALANRLRAVPGKLEFRPWDGRSLGWPDGSFDRVLSRFALARCADPTAAVREMHRVLRAGGWGYFLEAADGTAAVGGSAVALPQVLDRCEFVATATPRLRDATVLLRVQRAAQ